MSSLPINVTLAREMQYVGFHTNRFPGKSACWERAAFLRNIPAFLAALIHTDRNNFPIRTGSRNDKSICFVSKEENREKERARVNVKRKVGKS